MRIAFCGVALVVECPIKMERRIILESSSWPRADDLTPRELRELQGKVEIELATQPFYNVCGFGTADPKFRGGYVITATSDPRGCVVDRSGAVTKAFQEILRRVVSVGIEANPK